VEEATRSPIFHYLVKPVDPDDLAPAIAVAKARFAEWKRAREERDGPGDQAGGAEDPGAGQGILMESRQMTEQEAYRFLQKTSQDKNTPMIELAKKILLAAPLLQKG
jgi:two-component system, response regulator PdtaR